MNTTMDPTVFSVAAVPSITGLVELAKSFGLPDRYAPLAALLFGILAGFASAYPHQFRWESAAIAGLGMGLAAVGTHASATTVREHLPGNRRPHPHGRSDTNTGTSRSSGHAKTVRLQDAETADKQDGKIPQ